MILENGDRRVRYCTGLRGPTGAGDAEGGGKLVRPRGFTPTVLYIIVPVRRGERGGGPYVLAAPLGGTGFEGGPQIQCLWWMGRRNYSALSLFCFAQANAEGECNTIIRTFYDICIFTYRTAMLYRIAEGFG